MFENNNNILYILFIIFILIICYLIYKIIINSFVISNNVLSSELGIIHNNQAGASNISTKSSIIQNPLIQSTDAISNIIASQVSNFHPMGLGMGLANFSIEQHPMGLETIPSNFPIEQHPMGVEPPIEMQHPMGLETSPSNFPIEYHQPMGVKPPTQLQHPPITP